MKKKCVECKKRFSRMDSWLMQKGLFKRKYVCRHCLQIFLKKSNPESYNGSTIWICAHCRPPQKFTDRQEYLVHHYFSHN